MWIIPNQFKGKIEDEDKRLKLISENLLTNSGKEFPPPSFHPIKVWLNEHHKWVDFINVAEDINSHVQNISQSGLSFKHEAQDVIDDKYEDLPFLCQSSLKGYYIYIAVEEWDQDIKSESISSIKGKGWPTPLASDAHYLRLNKPVGETAWGTIEQRNLGSLPLSVHWVSQLYKTHQVNPRWFEQMMGLPIGWTDPYL